MTDLIILGGTVVDGTGAPARRADVLVRDGRIAEVGEGLTAPAGTEVLDASGALVTPGFIDTHTHVDPSLLWDPLCDPLPQHGVTTVLVGNCSLSLAPVRPEHTGAVTDLFAYIEDVPKTCFDLAVPYSWDTFAGYRDLLDAGGLAVHTAALIGHSMLRLFVMGDDAWHRAATAAEVTELARVLDQSLADGAFGLSTSWLDSDALGRPVPSRLADEAELDALFAVVGRHGGFVEFVPGLLQGTAMDDVARIGRLSARHDVTTTFNGLVVSGSPGMPGTYVDEVRRLKAEGARIWPQLSPRTVDFRINWASSMLFMTQTEGWHRIPNAPDDETRRALLQDPAWRTAAREEWDRVERSMFPVNDPARVRLIEVTRPELEPWLGRTFADLIAERGGHPSDVLADWVLENDLRPGVVVVGVGNADADAVASWLKDPDVLVAASDAGAHVQMMCAAGDTTLYLARHVRDRGDTTIEDGVWQLTGRQADVFGFHDRGRVAPGLVADLTVFALDELHWDEDVFVADLPDGGRRLRRPEGGYRFTVAGGVVTQVGGRLTGARPARVLRLT
jgi:N-acyl-D-aspartate/D-glutamate deacylase